MNHGQSNSSMATTRMETTHGLIYSMARAMVQWPGQLTSDFLYYSQHSVSAQWISAFLYSVFNNLRINKCCDRGNLIAICRCRLSLLPDLQFLCWNHWIPTSSDYSTSKKIARVLSSVHAIFTTCSVCWTSLCAACLYIIARPDSQFLCAHVLFVIFCGLRFSHILMTVICM